MKYSIELQKLSKRLHLSKSKHSKFNESSQLITFYILSAIWGIDIILRYSYNLIRKYSFKWSMYREAPIFLSHKIQLIFLFPGTISSLISQVCGKIIQGSCPFP